MMRVTVLSAVLMLSTASIASANEVESRFDWSGFYAGATIGYGFGDQDWTLVDNAGAGACGQCGTEVTDFNVDGFQGGVQAGYNYQVDQFVFGLEAEFSLSTADGRGTWIGGNPVGERDGISDVSWVATIGPRLGIAMDRTLFYAKGGWALSKQEFEHNNLVNTNNFQDDDTINGWFIGGGIEQVIMDRWTAKLEYNYLDYGSEKVELDRTNGVSPGPAVFDIDNTSHTIKLGLNHLF